MKIAILKHQQKHLSDTCNQNAQHEYFINGKVPQNNYKNFPFKIVARKY